MEFSGKSEVAEKVSENFILFFFCQKKYGRVIGAMNGREGNFIFLLLVKNVRYKTSSDTSKSESENLENPI